MIIMIFFSIPLLSPLSFLISFFLYPSLLSLSLQCNKTCISLACGKVVSIWRIRDSSCVSVTLPNLITDLKWRTNEAAAEPPILLVIIIMMMMMMMIDDR